MKTSNALIPLGVVGVLMLLATGQLTNFKSWMVGFINGGSSSTLPTTPDQHTILGDKGAQDSAQSAADGLAQAQGGLSGILGGLNSAKNFDIFKPIAAGIGGDTAYVQGPWAINPSFSGTAQNGKFTLSGAVSWFDASSGKLVTAFDNSLSGKSFTYKNDTGAIVVPNFYVGPVVGGISQLTPQQVHALSQS